jgi:hypothetical protein
LKTLDGRESTKAVLYFSGFKKQLPLNKTNFQAVQMVTGEKNSDKWPGAKIVVYPDMTAMAGRPVECVRIKVPLTKSEPAAEMADDAPPDDGVPFNDDAPDFEADEEAA